MDDDDHELSGLIRTHATRHRASPALDAAIRTEIALQSAASRKRTRSPEWHWPAWGFAGVGFAFGVLLTVLVVLLSGQAVETDKLAAELVNSHVRALMVSHLTDVASSNRHTVKPWFQGKLDFSPAVQDLAEQGFILVGGRLDYVSGRPVAALVYRRHDHLINVFIWPGSGNEGQQASTRQGFNLLHWHVDGMQYWAVSDAHAEDLAALGKLLH
nr:anti-sigma factor [Candidatus Accumulibacter aalborgensis]